MSTFNPGPSSRRLRTAYGVVLFVAFAFALAWIFAFPVVENFLAAQGDPSRASATPSAAPTSATLMPALTPIGDADTTATLAANGEWGPNGSDLELAHIDGNADPPTALLLRLRNYGLDDFSGEVEFACSGGGILRSALMCPGCSPQDPVVIAGSARMEMRVSHQLWTLRADLARALDPWNYNYVIECTVSTNRDPDPRNNSGVLAYP